MGRRSRGLGVEGSHPTNQCLGGEGDRGQEGCGGWGGEASICLACACGCVGGVVGGMTGDRVSRACLRMRLRREWRVASCEFGCVCGGQRAGL